MERQGWRSRARGRRACRGHDRQGDRRDPITCRWRDPLAGRRDRRHRGDWLAHRAPEGGGRRQCHCRQPVGTSNRGETAGRDRIFRKGNANQGRAGEAGRNQPATAKGVSGKCAARRQYRRAARRGREAACIAGRAPACEGSWHSYTQGGVYKRQGRSASPISARRAPRERSRLHRRPCACVRGKLASI